MSSRPPPGPPSDSDDADRSGAAVAPDATDPGAFPLSDRDRWIQALILISSAFCAGISVFVTLPLISLLLERDGTPAWLTGIVLGMFSVSVLLAGPLMPSIIARHGTFRVAIAGVVLSTVGTLAYPFFDGVAAWMVIRFITGLGLAAHWIVSETWLNTLTADHDRGRMIAVYSTMFAVGIAGGPVIITIVGLGGLVPWGVSAALIAISGFPLLLIRGVAPKLPLARSDGPTGTLPAFRRVLERMPVLMTTGIVAGLCESAVFAMIPVYGVRIGLTEGLSSLLLTAFVIGNIAIQFPLGVLVDRGDRRLVLACCAVLAGMIGLVIPHAGSGVVLLAMLFLWGGAIFGFYTIGLIGIGARAPAPVLASANAGFIIMYEAGSMIGPVFSGYTMERFGAAAMPLSVTAVALPFALLAFWRRRTEPVGSGG